MSKKQGNNILKERTAAQPFVVPESLSIIFDPAFWPLKEKKKRLHTERFSTFPCYDELPSTDMLCYMELCAWKEDMNDMRGIE